MNSVLNKLSFVSGTCVKRYLSPPPHYLSLQTISLLSRPVINQWLRGQRTFLSTTQEYDRGRQEKTKQTNKLGVNQELRKVCNTTCMCIPDSRYGLTLAWVTSENSTMLLESDILRLFFTGPYLVSSPLCSGVWCWLPLRSSTPTSAVRLSPVQPQLLSRVHPPTPGLLPPTASPGSRRQLSFASPYHFRVRRDFRSKNPLSGFAPKQTIESSALAAYPHSATLVHLFFLIFIWAGNILFVFCHSISVLGTLPCYNGKQYGLAYK